MAKNNALNFNLPSADDLFSTEESRAEARLEKSSTSIPRKSAIFLIIHLRCGWTLPCRK